MAFKPSEYVVDLAFEDMPGIPDGTTPEPSPARVRDWQRRLNTARSTLRLDVAEDATFAEIAQAALAQDVGTMDDLVIDAYAVLCGADAPTSKRPTSPGPAPRPPGAAASEDERAEHDKAAAEHDKARSKYETKVAEWNAGWSGGTPTREQLAGLPFRYQAAWFEYLNEAFANPTSGTAATKN